MLAKKTIIKLAFKEAYGKDLTDEMLDGQIAVVFADGEDAVATLGAVNKNMKELNTKEGEKIVFMGAYFEGDIQDAATTTKLASLPSKDVLLAKFMGSLMSPVSGLARFFDGAKTKLDEISGKTVADLLKEESGIRSEESDASETTKTTETTEAPAAEERSEKAAEAAAQEAKADKPAPETTEISESDSGQEQDQEKSDPDPSD